MEPSDPALWIQVDRYFSDLLVPRDEALAAVLQANKQADLPAIDVSPLQGKFLEFLVRISGARRVLEIGTLGGYSTIWLARGLSDSGRIVTLELDPHHAEVARANLQIAGVSDSFDFIFIDADKESYPDYLKRALKLSRPGTVIVADNVVRDGEVANAECNDPRVQGVQRFVELAAREPRLRMTVLQTVGVKGYDGFALAVVLA
jgi:predicted O-methyltransferase YrrM